MAFDFVPVALAQLWQVTLLIFGVAAINRWVAHRRPHLSHLLWLVVLLKCVTPPLWASSGGVFCWLQPEGQIETTVSAEFETTSANWEQLLEVDTQAVFDTDDSVGEFAGVMVDDAEADELFQASKVLETPEKRSDERGFGEVTFAVWLGVSLLVILGVTVRWLRFWRLVRTSAQRESPELVSLVASLSQQLGVRRRVRLIVTESLVGPAVIGFFRVTVLIPSVVADKLQGKAVAPILAHELLHIRRGDLWVGLLQTVAQAMWWFHPLVWWVGRVTTREAERCCDEEVLGELKCDPASYARALLDVLDLKSQLKPVPVFPGVRPVDITSQRLERIMTLRQGCRRRSPWWCWLVAIGAAALTLPGAAFVVVGEDVDPAAASSAALSSNGDVPSGKRPVNTEVHHTGEAVSKAYDVEDFSKLIGGSDAELQGEFRKLIKTCRSARKSVVEWRDEIPIVVTSELGHAEIGKCLSLLRSANPSSEILSQLLHRSESESELRLYLHVQLVSGADDSIQSLRESIEARFGTGATMSTILDRSDWDAILATSRQDTKLSMIAEPFAVAFNGSFATLLSCVEYPISVLQGPDSRHVLMDYSNWSGWRMNFLPFRLKTGEFYVGGELELQSVVGYTAVSTDSADGTPENKTVPITDRHVIGFGTSLTKEQVFVVVGAPVTKPNGRVNSTLLALRIKQLPVEDSRFALKETPTTTGKGVNSDAGISGKFVLAAGQSDVAAADVKKTSAEQEPKHQGGAETSAASLHAGRLVFRHGGCRLEAVPREGSELDVAIDSEELTVLKAPLTLMLTRTDGFGFTRPIQMQADQCRISQGDSLKVELSGNVLLTAPQQLIRAKADSLLMTIHADGTAKADNGIKCLMKNVAMTIQLDPAKDSSLLRAEEISIVLDAKTFKAAEITASKVESLRVSDAKRTTAERNGLSPVFSEDRKLLSQWDTIRRRRSLQKLVSPKFDRTPLKEAVAWFRTAGDLNIILDELAIEEEGVTGTTPVTLELNEVAIHSALRLLLKPLNLGIMIDEESNVVIVTSKLRMQGKMVAAAYPVADLVIPMPKSIHVQLSSDGATSQSDGVVDTSVLKPVPGTLYGQHLFDTTTLIELISTVVEPDSWQEVGGMGTIRSNETTLSLVIRQTEAVHREISDLLDQLRRLQDLQIVVRGDVLKLPEQSLGDLKFETTGKSQEHRFAILTKEQVIELKSAGPSKSLPAVTLFNGQKCVLMFGDKFSGNGMLTLRPVAAADRSVVRLGLKCQTQTTGNTAASLSALPPLASGTSILLDVTDTFLTGKRTPGNRTLLLVTSEVVVVEEEPLDALDVEAEQLRR
jgi:beta-lactamase regulating signal transducer with metallopeptidase domain